ncbi:MAG: UDP phosphate-alpha-4-amino-4-deoxy-L- arabinose arabinosyl transferase [Leptospiraceae bacterium]|nr:UDP phosphate-alpha-4-amino-4-deoxy-L- arabinose arabinosyl transferase [Leptospiraceae bacterium]
MLLLFLFHFLLYFSLFILSSPFYPLIWPDEVLFYSPASSFASSGVLATTVLDGLIEGMEHHTLWMPPVYMLFNSLILSLSNQESINLLRFASLFLGGFNALIIMFIGKKMNFSKNSIWFLGSLVLGDFLFWKISSTARMESICLMFALLSILFSFMKFRYSILITGMFAGLSFLSHPFGIVHSPIIAFNLWTQKRFDFKTLLFLGLGFLLPSSLWLAYILPEWNLFLLQFGAQLGRKKDLLFSVFTLVTKIKIIFSGFRFPYFKLLSFLFLLGMAIWEIKSIRKQTERLDSIKFNTFIFPLSYLLIVLLFLFLSSESWYVYYLVPPISFLIVYFYEKNSRIGKGFLFLILIYHLLGSVSFYYQNFIQYDLKKNTELFYQKISTAIRGKNRIYLQSLPDPYFYLKENYPEKRILEFIPGELPLPVEYAEETFLSQDAYIFYNQDLIHPYLKKYLLENENLFEKTIIDLPVPKGADYKLFALIYSKI